MSSAIIGHSEQEADERRMDVLTRLRQEGIDPRPHRTVA
jgi:hypothetical protein